MSRRKRVVFGLVLPTLLLGLGAGGAALVFRISPSAAQAEPSRQLQVVEVVEARAEAAAVEVEGTGTVVAAREMTVTPEISGRIVKRSSAIEPGGRLRAGDLIARIDAREYRIALRQERARVEAAQVELELEQGRNDLSRREWQILGMGAASDQPPLSRRQPQLRAARATVEVGESAIERAELNLSRTVIRAPWNAVVVEARAETGQVVSPGTKLVTIVGTDQVWIRVPLPARSLSDIVIPGVSAEEGARATVFNDMADGRASEWEGRVIRLESSLDTETRTAQLLLSVDNPFDAPDGGLPLIPGTFVRVAIEGRERAGVFRVPRSAIRDGRSVWVVDEDNRLAVRPIELGWGDGAHVYVTRGLSSGDRVVVSPLSNPIAGEEVRTSSASTEELRTTSEGAGVAS